MKKLFLFLAAGLLAGCVSTPRVVSTTPVYTKAPPAAEPSPYRFSQEPKKRVIEDDGPEYRRHIREMQRMRLEHERRLAAIEQAGEERLLAEEKGVALPSASAPEQAETPAPAAPQAVFGYMPPAPVATWGYSPPNSGYPVSGSVAWVGGGAYRYGWVGGRGGRWLGKLDRWLTQSQSTPGYSHTGGPVTIVHTYSVGGTMGGGGGFSSGLNFFGYRR